VPRLPRWTDIIYILWCHHLRLTFHMLSMFIFFPWYFFTQDSLESPCTCGVFFCFLLSKVYAFQRHLAFFLKTAGNFQFSSSIFESLVACGRTQTCMLKVGKTFLNLLGANLNTLRLDLLLMEEIWLTSWYRKYAIIYKVLYIPGGCLGFLSSTVPSNSRAILLYMQECIC